MVTLFTIIWLKGTIVCLDKSTSNIIEKEIQARMNDLGETREEAAKIVLNKRAYGVLDQPGELRRKSIDERSAIIQSNERLSKPAADQKATYEVDFSKIQKDNSKILTAEEFSRSTDFKGKKFE